MTVLGPESTGKTTLAVALARRFGGETSAEAARAHAVALAGTRALGADDVGPIARAQAALEDAAEARARAAGRGLVVRDTDLVSTATYAAWYYALRTPWLDDAVRARRADLYLLCDTDLPWRGDPARDSAMQDPATRDAVRDAFVAALARYECRWTWVRGAGPSRERAAVEAVRALLPPGTPGVRTADAP